MAISMSPQEWLFRMMGGGNEAANEAMEQMLQAGGNALSLGGVELARTVILESSTRTITATTLTAVPGWTLPTITYIGRPIELELWVPSITHPTAGASVSFEIRNGAGTKLASCSPTVPTAGANLSALAKNTLPIAGQFSLNVGDTLTGLQVFARVSAGTATVHSYFNDALVGTTPVLFIARQH